MQKFVDGKGENDVVQRKDAAVDVDRLKIFGCDRKRFR